MTSMTQYIIVGIVVLASAAYLGWRAWQSLSGGGDPCSGCSGCALKDAKRPRGCPNTPPTGGKDKKKREKFGDKK